MDTVQKLEIAMATIAYVTGAITILSLVNFMIETKSCHQDCKQILLAKKLCIGFCLSCLVATTAWVLV